MPVIETSRLEYSFRREARGYRCLTLYRPMKKLEAPINPNGKQDVPEPSTAIPDTLISGPDVCNCDQALGLIELLKAAYKTIHSLREKDEKDSKRKTLSDVQRTELYCNHD